MKRSLLFLFAVTTAIMVNGQNFLKAGRIEFERKTNVHRLFLDWTEEENSSFGQEFKKMIPQFRVDYFDMVFSEGKTVYKPGKTSPDADKFSFFGSGAAASNTVFKDLENQLIISQKQVFEDQFLITDSLASIEWKLQPETRTIAGFECRKALGRICDSVVVVAFYTEEIIPSSGPESFSGLPGMIMGIAIPRLFTTWFATKVEMANSGDEAKITPPAKGKKVTGAQMMKRINDGIKSWDEKHRNKNLWLVTL